MIIDPYRYASGVSMTDPSDIPGVVLWLDGSDVSSIFQIAGYQPFGPGGGVVTADGQTLGCWQDKSGNANHMNQPDSNFEPTYRTNIQNGLSIVRAIGAANDDYLYSTSSVLSQDREVAIFYVAAVTSDESVGAVFCNSNTSADRIVAFVDSRSVQKRCGLYTNATGDNLADLPADIGAATFHQFSVIITNDTITSRLDGTAGTTEAIDGAGLTTNDYTRIFNQLSNQTYLFGDLGDLIVVDGTLSAAWIQAIEAWLKNKWATP
jgi:hypothetical protein